MKYVSTRGKAPELGFEDVLLTGLARDGGLYLPEQWPQFSQAEIARMAGQPYEVVALEVMRPFVTGEISDDEMAGIIRGAYASFRHRTVAPLVQIGPSDWVLELFHGPTLAFKDVAMQVLARLMDRTLAKRGKRATIVGATSGDTGGAAIEAFRGREAIDIFILYPEGRVSDVQRRQMTTPSEANVHAIAVEGTFDDCQNILKELFNDLELRDRIGLAGVNSINWARLVSQIVYYFTSAVALGAPDRDVSFTVPTGNFGDIFAGYAALSMGLPIERLVVATNVNDILVRTLESGIYEPKGVVATHSPSMDIQISSNFERLLFEIADRSSERLSEQMAELKSAGRFALEADELALMRQFFDAARTSEEETLEEIRRLERDTGYLADPHTAVGTAAARKVARDASVPMVTLATAHPAKFPAAIKQAVGRLPDLPAVIRQQAEMPERSTTLKADAGAIAAFIEGRRGGRESK
ncbi:MAG: threonine synthase [Proteobacteria bacterium]|nr:threonine synthase [Pseudomonadota bacterium]